MTGGPGAIASVGNVFQQAQQAVNQQSGHAFDAQGLSGDGMQAASLNVNARDVLGKLHQSLAETADNSQLGGTSSDGVGAELKALMPGSKELSPVPSGGSGLDADAFMKGNKVLGKAFNHAMLMAAAGQVTSAMTSSMSMLLRQQ